jgi:hypothetical protein
MSRRGEPPGRMRQRGAQSEPPRRIPRAGVPAARGATKLGPRPTARRVPCGDARKGSSGQRGYASATGSRASSRADGCSAGTCACSQQTPTTGCMDQLIIGVGPCISDRASWHAQATLKGRACQGTGGREARSNDPVPQKWSIVARLFNVKPTRRTDVDECGVPVVAVRECC